MSNGVLEVLIYFVGAGCVLAVALGLLAVLVWWATEQIIRTLKFERTIIEWYVDKARQARKGSNL